MGNKTEIECIRHDCRACEKDVEWKAPKMEVKQKDRLAQEDKADKMEPEMEEAPVRNCRLIVIQDPVEEKRVKAEEKRLKADEEKRLKAEEKRLKADQANEEKRLKDEEKRLKVEAAAHKKTCDLERKQQEKRKREEEKAAVADIQKRIKAMAAMAKGPATKKYGAANAAAEGHVDAEKAPTKVAAEAAGAEDRTVATETGTAKLSTVEKAAAEKTAPVDAEMAMAELTAAKDKMAMMVEMSEVPTM